jgi:hypothetical protein
MKYLLVMLSLAAGMVAAAQGGKELPISFKMVPDDAGRGSCHCPSGETPVAASITWTLATCKSNCERGLGFRCGREGYIVCDRGTVVICKVATNCSASSSSSRKMTASYSFYDDNTLKLTFQNAVPREEKGNSVFEVEEDDLIPLPAEMLIGGVHYSGYQVQKGNYKINYSDKEYGSVTIKVELKK